MSPQRNSSSVFKIASLAFYHGFGILSLQKSPRAKLGRRERHVVTYFTYRPKTSISNGSQRENKR